MLILYLSSKSSSPGSNVQCPNRSANRVGKGMLMKSERQIQYYRPRRLHFRLTYLWILNGLSIYVHRGDIVNIYPRWNMLMRSQQGRNYSVFVRYLLGDQLASFYLSQLQFETHYSSFLVFIYSVSVYCPLVSKCPLGSYSKVNSVRSHCVGHTTIINSFSKVNTRFDI